MKIAKSALCGAIRTIKIYLKFFNFLLEFFFEYSMFRNSYRNTASAKGVNQDVLNEGMEKLVLTFGIVAYR